MRKKDTEKSTVSIGRQSGTSINIKRKYIMEG